MLEGHIEPNVGVTRGNYPEVYTKELTSIDREQLRLAQLHVSIIRRQIEDILERTMSENEYTYQMRVLQQMLNSCPVSLFW